MKTYLELGANDMLYVIYSVL